MKISATIITYNEERNIARCIDSLSGVADEIVVMDSFSTDATKEICLKKGVVFIEQKWMGYAAQKNLLNTHAKHEMILSIDADESLSLELKDSIITLKKEGRLGVFQVNRRTNYCGKWINHSGWYPDIKIRLFPKKGAKWVGDLVHEELNFDYSTSPILLLGDMAHFSYYSMAQHRERADAYSRLTAKKYVANGNRIFIGQPFFSGLFRFFQMYFFKLGFLDGVSGFHIARISALSNIFKYREVLRLQREMKKNG